MIFRLGYYQFMKNWLMNLFIVIQLVAVLLLSVTVSSVITYNVKDYVKFADYFNSEGLMLRGRVFNEDKTVMQENEELEAVLKKAEVTSLYTSYFSVPDLKEDEIVLAYDRKTLHRHIPEMAEGKWLSSLKSGDGSVLHVVVEEGCAKVGDTLTARFDTGDKTVEFPVQVIGVLEPDAEILGYLYGELPMDGVYTDIYQTLDEAEGAVVLTTKEELEQTAAYYQAADMDPIMDDIIFVKYDKDITAEEMVYNETYISNHSMIHYKCEFSKIRTRSMDILMSRLMFLVPILASIFILMMISAVCMNSLVMKQQMHNYAVYNICGMPWGACTGINMISICLTYLLALAFALIALYAAIRGKQVMETTITFGTPEMLSCLFVGVLYIALSGLLPVHTLRKTNASRLLVENQ